MNFSPIFGDHVLVVTLQQFYLCETLYLAVSRYDTTYILGLSVPYGALYPPPHPLGRWVRRFSVPALLTSGISWQRRRCRAVRCLELGGRFDVDDTEYVACREFKRNVRRPHLLPQA